MWPQRGSKVKSFPKDCLALYITSSLRKYIKTYDAAHFHSLAIHYLSTPIAFNVSKENTEGYIILENFNHGQIYR